MIFKLTIRWCNARFLRLFCPCVYVLSLTLPKRLFLQRGRMITPVMVCMSYFQDPVWKDDYPYDLFKLAYCISDKLVKRLWTQLSSGIWRCVFWCEYSDVSSHSYNICWFTLFYIHVIPVRKNGKVVLWLTRLVAGISPQKPGFDPGSVHVGFLVDKVALRQVLPLVLRFSPVNFIPPVLRYMEKRKKTNYLHPRVAQ
jgi:hypothetical protein